MMSQTFPASLPLKVLSPFIVRAVESDLLEETIGPVGEGSAVRFRMKPWEIKTLRVSKV
jgi:hypothetical protein